MLTETPLILCTFLSDEDGIAIWLLFPGDLLQNILKIMKNSPAFKIEKKDFTLDTNHHQDKLSRPMVGSHHLTEKGYLPEVFVSLTEVLELCRGISEWRETVKLPDWETDGGPIICWYWWLHRNIADWCSQLHFSHQPSSVCVRAAFTATCPYWEVMCSPTVSLFPSHSEEQNIYSIYTI